MRPWRTLALLVIAGWIAVAGGVTVWAFNLPLPDSPGPTADAVFGQPNFTTSAPGSSPTSMTVPHDIAFDASGVMYYGERK
jgi:hypothetical protein